MAELSHFDEHGGSRMVDTSLKPETIRIAKASAIIRMKPETLVMIQNRQLAKGDVCEVARLAGIMAAKKTADLIPLCHPLPLTSVQVRFEFLDAERLRVELTTKTIGRTGVEMEALTGASISALTIYDMCKAVDRSMTIETIQLIEKSGGQSGDFVREVPTNPERERSES